MRNGEELKSRVLQALEKSNGLSISDVSRTLGVHYSTASKYVAVLEAEKKIFCTQIGMAKFFRVFDSNGGPHD